MILGSGGIKKKVDGRGWHIHSHAMSLLTRSKCAYIGLSERRIINSHYFISLGHQGNDCRAIMASQIRFGVGTFGRTASRGQKLVFVICHARKLFFNGIFRDKICRSAFNFATMTIWKPNIR